MPRRSKNRFGYNHFKTGFSQLEKLLNLQPASWDSDALKASLKELCDKHLDVNLTASAQEAALLQIEEELRIKHDNLFSGKDAEKKMYFAVHSIMSFHNAKRGQEGCRKSRGKEKSSKEVFPKEEPVDVDLTKMAPEKEFASKPLTTVQPSRLGRLPLPTRTHFRMDPPAHPTDAFNSTLHIAARITDTKGTPQQIASMARPLRVTDLNKPNDAGTAAVAEFLRACNPSMERYFISFVNFGCTSEVHLRSLAKFTEEKRYTILRQLLGKHCRAESFTEMDVAILESQLENYFS